jgi:hypothetical protein
MKDLIFYEDLKLCHGKYEPEMDPAIKNWEGSGCIRIFKDEIFIKFISFVYFIDLLKRLNNIGTITIYTDIS